MTAATCGAAEILRSGGPVAVPFRPCCAAVLLRAAAPPSEPDGPASHRPALCPLVADPAAEAQLLLLTEPITVGEP